MLRCLQAFKEVITVMSNERESHSLEEEVLEFKWQGAGSLSTTELCLDTNWHEGWSWLSWGRRG